MTTHHMGNGLASPCGLEPASVYRGFQGGFTTEWTEVDCPACLGTRIDVRPSVPEPEHENLQVFMAHPFLIEAFRRWVAENGWELKLIPRFNEDDDTYVPTHMIVTANLEQIMRDRAAECRRVFGEG